MTKKIKTTAPVSSVGADGAQPQLKNHTEIIANETAQINLQAAQRRCYNLFPNTKMGRGSFGQGLDGFIKGTKSTEQCD